MINKVRVWESQILRPTFRHRMRTDETWVGHKIRTSRFMRLCWRKMGLPLLTEKIANKVWTTMTWAVYDGDVPVMLALRSLLVWRTTAWWRSRSSWGMAWDPNNVQIWKHKVGFHNRGVQWDTPMARWAGDGKDWIELMTPTRPQKDDVIRNLLESMKQPVDKKMESKGSVPKKKPRDLPPLDLGTPVPGESLTLEIKGDKKTIVDWMNGHAKMKTWFGTVEKAQNLLQIWWGRGIRLRQQTTDLVTHTLREHNKEADLWAGKRCEGARRKMGGTPLALRGTRFSVSVNSGMEALTTANAESVPLAV